MDKSLPFELLVLEWALSTATQALSAEVHDLLDHAERVHEKLTKKVELPLESSKDWKRL